MIRMAAEAWWGITTILSGETVHSLIIIPTSLRSVFKHHVLVVSMSNVAFNLAQGTCPFQSYNILSRGGEHTFMGDLESFYYVMCWIVTGYDGPNTSFKPLPFHHEWDVDSIERGADAKAAHILAKKFKLPVTRYFRKKPVHRMVIRLHRLSKGKNLNDSLQEKGISAADDGSDDCSSDENSDSQVRPVVKQDDQYYDEFIRIVERAKRVLIKKSKAKNSLEVALGIVTPPARSITTDDPISADISTLPNANFQFSKARSPSPSEGKGKQAQNSTERKRTREGEAETEARGSNVKRSRINTQEKSREG